MKKTCVFALATILSMPAFAVSDKADMYGTKTENITLDTPVAQEQTVAFDNIAGSEQVTNESMNIKTPTNPDIKFPRGMQLGVGISVTSGLDGFVGYNNKKFDSFWWKRLGIRLGYASTKPVKSFINKTIDRYMGDGVDVGDNLTITDGSIEARQMAALVDFYPFGDTWFLGGWRLTGGYVFGKMDVEAMLTGKDNRLNSFVGREFQLGSNIWRYTGTDTDVHGTAKANWDIKGPYAGTGFDLGLFGGLKIYMDAGVVFTNKAAELALDIPYDTAALLEYSSDGGNTWTSMSVPSEYTNVVNELRANIDNTISDAQKELDKYKFFPMVKLGFMYRF